jgi:hypothetical protein
VAQIPITALHGKDQAGLEAKKPTAPDAPSFFFATDTGRLWAYDGTYWWSFQMVQA